MEHSPEHRSIRGRVEQAARCGNGKKGQAEISTRRTTGHGFLSHCFEPLRGRDTLPYNQEGEAVLLSSFANLAALYGYEQPDVSQTEFPRNICTLYREATKILDVKGTGVIPLLMEIDGVIRLATAREASTSTTLFYLPVYPLWKWMQGGTRKRESNLMMSVFAYLHQVVGIPFFNDCSYIGRCYRTMLDWLEEDDGWTDPEELRVSLSSVQAALYTGKRMHRQVKHPYHLHAWENRLRTFTKGDATAIAIADIADSFLKLYTDHPERTLADNIHTGLLQPTEDMRVEMEQIFSFIWKEDGWLGEQLFEVVNVELMECCAMDEPVALQYFDTPQHEVMPCLDFETRLYGLLCDLAETLTLMI